MPTQGAFYAHSSSKSATMPRKHLSLLAVFKKAQAWDPESAAPPILLSRYDAAKDSLTYSSSFASFSAVTALLTSSPPSSGGPVIFIEGQLHRISLKGDSSGRYYALVTSVDYPPRIACKCLAELAGRFESNFGAASLTDLPAVFAPKCKPVLKELLSKYNEPREVDAIANVQTKIDAVKLTMQVRLFERDQRDEEETPVSLALLAPNAAPKAPYFIHPFAPQENIAVMLINADKVEDIDARAVELTKQSLVFRKRSDNLRKKIRCKNMKWILELGGVFLLIAGLIVMIVMLNVNAGNNSTRSRW